MKNEKGLSVYEAPEMKEMEIILETAILVMSDSNFENPTEGEESDW